MASDSDWIHRHSLNVRICHWINAVAVVGLLVTGVAIFITYPELYWGPVGYAGHEPSFKLSDLGITTRYAWEDEPRRWGRNYHFTFAWMFVLNGVAYVISSFVRRNFSEKLKVSRHELTLAHLCTEFREHLRFRAPRGEAATRYNTLQKLSYLFVIFVLSPMIIVTGLGQSPGITAAAPWLLDAVGGHQSMRSLHMIAVLLMVAFILVHVLQVFVVGVAKEMRSMITGKVRAP